MERSYLEVKVSFLHIVVLLGGIILIGSFLFYLGYQSGKSSVGPSKAAVQADSLQETPAAEEIRLNDDTAAEQTQSNKKQQEPSINDELKLHQLPLDNNNAETETQPKPLRPEPSKTVSREPYYAIQVGAFTEHPNAQKYSAKFAAMGYPTEILSTVGNDKKLFRVRVGNFKTHALADKEKKKLEKLENKRFGVVKSN